MFFFRSLPSSIVAILIATAGISDALPNPNPGPFQIGSRHLNKRATEDEYVAYSAAGIDQLQVW